MATIPSTLKATAVAMAMFSNGDGMGFDGQGIRPGLGTLAAFLNKDVKNVRADVRKLIALGVLVPLTERKSSFDTPGWRSGLPMAYAMRLDALIPAHMAGAKIGRSRPKPEAESSDGRVRGVEMGTSDASAPDLGRVVEEPRTRVTETSDASVRRSGEMYVQDQKEREEPPLSARTDDESRLLEHYQRRYAATVGKTLHVNGQHRARMAPLLEHYDVDTIGHALDAFFDSHDAFVVRCGFPIEIFVKQFGSWLARSRPSGSEEDGRPEFQRECERRGHNVACGSPGECNQRAGNQATKAKYGRMEFGQAPAADQGDDVPCD